MTGILEPDELQDLDELADVETGDETLRSEATIGDGGGVGGATEEAISLRSSQANLSQTGSALSQMTEAQRGEVEAAAEDPLEASLTLNEMYQEAAGNFVELVQGKLQHVRTQLAMAEEAGAATVANPVDAPGKRRKATKVPALTYVNPYFKDADGMACPPNSDQIRKVAEGEWDMLAAPPKRWSPAEISALEGAVRKDVLRITTDRQLQRQELIKLKEASEGAALSATDRERLAEESASLRREVEATIASQDAILGAFKDWAAIDWLSVANGALKGTRGERECQLKWEMELAPQWSRAAWSQPELKELKAIISRFPDGKVVGRDWERVATELGTGRTAWQVFEVYQSQLNKALISGPWSKDEDEKLISVVAELRMGDEIPWDNVAHCMEGRTRAQVHARWTRTLNPEVKRGRWTEDEDFLLLVNVGKFNAKDWGKVAAQIPCRTDTQCRERWLSFLTEEVEYGPWTPEEDDILRACVEVFGVGAWSRCSKLLFRRTPGMVKSRWHRLEKLRTEMEKALEEAEANGERPPTMEELEASIVQPHIAETEERKARIIQRKERLMARYQEMYGESFDSFFARENPDTAATREQIRQDEIELALKALPAAQRAPLMGKLSQLRWRHHGTPLNAAKDEPALRSRNILAASGVTAPRLYRQHQHPPRPLGRSHLDKNPVERAALIQELRRALSIIDRSKALKAKRDAQRQAFYRNVGHLSRSLREGKLLPPSVSSISLYAGLQLALPSLRLSAAELKGDGSRSGGYGLGRLSDANAKAIRNSPAFDTLRKAMLALIAWPRILATIPVSGWHRPNAIRLLQLQDILNTEAGPVAQPNFSSVVLYPDGRMEAVSEDTMDE